jgi:putative ABC transport system permease protein
MMFRAFDADLYSFNIDWRMYILAIVVVFVVVGVSMLLSVDKIKNDSIIEALKYDMV